MAEKTLFIVDTTLRDGEQRAGLAFSRNGKKACARIMDRIGIYQIEAGIPSMGKSEKEAIIDVKEACAHTLVSVWCRMNENDIYDAFDCRPDIIHIGVPVSDIQIKVKLRKDRQYVVDQMKRCFTLAAEHGYEVTLGFEDSSRADLSFLKYMAALSLSLGAKRIRYADTVGVASPHKIACEISSLVKTGAEVEIHAHDDLGLAAANTLEAAKSGAQYANTTFFGIGERAGNCNIRKLAAAASGLFNLGFSNEYSKILNAEQEIGEALGLNCDGTPTFLYG
jgi:homocitrate synthase NifV